MVAPEPGDLARFAYYGLHALQHRGQEAAGIAAGYGEGRLRVVRREGLVSQAIQEDDLEALDPCRSVIGHVRYSTSGNENERENDQPLVAKLASGHLALAHNGTLINAEQLAGELEEQGAIFRSTVDSEIFVHLLARHNSRPFRDSLHLACSRVRGAFCLLMLHRGVLYAVRDPHGFRPLFVGQKDGAGVVASETSAFDLIGARVDRELAPGELAILVRDGLTVEPFLTPRRPAPCIFELIYFARPDGLVFGQSVYEFRERCGARLARETAAEVGPEAVVVPIPDSGVPSAMGYARQAGLAFELGLVRSHYAGRTFIQPFQEIRSLKVKLKLNAVRSVVENRDVVLVDDSLVRGTTCRRIVELVRERGARKVHVAIASPPIADACHFGVDTPNRDKLAAGRMDREAIRGFLGADTLSYISFEGLSEVYGSDEFCSGCFTSRYPMDVNGADVSIREG